MQEGDQHNGLGLGTYVMILRGSVSSSLIPSQSGNETTNLNKLVCAIPLYILTGAIYKASTNTLLNANYLYCFLF